jgi:hypothetical protein
MRKLLLTSVCALGAIGVVHQAVAQAPAAPAANPIQGQLIGRPGATPGANNNNNSFGTARPGPSAVPTPGTIVIHFNSRIVTQWGLGWNSLQNATAGNTRTSNQLTSYMRLFGGADGMLANGMRYGGAWEVRMNTSASSTAGVANATTTPGASNPASQAGSVSTAQTLYARRTFIYLGADKLGIVRIGASDGLIGLFDGGRTTMQTYSPTANFNGSDLQSMISGNSSPLFSFMSGSGDDHVQQKIVYLSPNFSGFDFGLSYTPAAANAQAFCGAATNSGCANITTSSVAMDGARYTNMVGAGVRYNGNVGPVNVLAYGVYQYGGHVNFSGTAAAAQTAVTAPTTSSWNGQHDNLSFGSVGVALTYEGFTLAGNFMGGAMNGRMAARPSGGASTAAWLVGAQYQVPGIPLVVGTAFASIDSQGAVGLTTVSQRHEYQWAIGGSYTLAPGLVVFADYLYQNRKQSGFNFLTGVPNAAGSNVNSSVQGQGLILGAMLNW